MKYYVRVNKYPIKKQFVDILTHEDEHIIDFERCLKPAKVLEQLLLVVGQENRKQKGEVSTVES